MALPRLGVIEAYLSAKDRLDGMTLAEFVEKTADFEVFPLRYRGEVRGAMLVKGSEVHACVAPPWYAREAIRVINAVIEKHGEATTHATTDAGRRIVEKLGFVKCGETYRRTEKWALRAY